jgi:methylglutaconyl-CoA hydratase
MSTIIHPFPRPARETAQTAMSYTTIELERTPAGIGRLWLNRSELRNAFNDTMIGELTEAFGALEADAAVRAVVLGGRGPVFCAGADLHWMKRMAGYTFEQNLADALGLAGMLRALRTLRKPTVARVHGHVFAGGMGLVAACDIALAARGAEFCISEAKLGLIPAVISPYVIAAMGERAARRYMLTAERFSAEEAHRIGFVHACVEPAELDSAIDELAGHLLAGGPAAHAATKDLVRAVAGRPISEDLIADTATRIAATRASAEGREGIQSFLEKRKPAWVGESKAGADAQKSAKKK